MPSHAHKPTYPAYPGDESPTFSLIADLPVSEDCVYRKGTTGAILGEDESACLVYFHNHEVNRPHSFWTKLIG